MAVASCLSLALPIRAIHDQGLYRHNFARQGILGTTSRLLHFSSAANGCPVKAKAAPGNPKPKPESVICTDCDGNGAVLCSQCKGSGVNAEDIFNGQFKKGDSCWLCGGIKDILCGNCNGAGFVGGFLSTRDE
ncbi:hypothetical protein Tsubulata_018126 [Turnera subulata]|uniref:BSD2 cysteine rich domain-containing protein n=1 Tax=Turnera subulata TaxID=218843 RepID=A0A9Q0FWQ4_9ROSI|nr:hypothetical protein Tsubulata_018126 [Turnera subulata]